MLVQPCGLTAVSIADYCSCNCCRCNYLARDAVEPTMTQEHQLEQWLAQERAQQARMEAGPGPGSVRPEQVAGLGGLDLMRRMVAGELPYPSIARTLDFLLLEANEGRELCQSTPGP